jgi:hypothetical protein
MIRAVLYLEDFSTSQRIEHPIFPNGFRIVECHPKPLKLQERACRAYCERVDYTIMQVCVAKTPEPDRVQSNTVERFNLTRYLGVFLKDPKKEGFLELFRTYRVYDSKHPYYIARNLLESGVADVLVKFCEAGPSRSVWGEDAAKFMSREEYASLWEIETPSAFEREHYDVMAAIRDARSVEEIPLLTDKLDALMKRKRAEEQQLAERQDQQVPKVITKVIKRAKNTTATWEYNTLVFDPSTNAVVKLMGNSDIEGVQPQVPVPAALEAVGSQGWEVVGIYQAEQQSHFLLKRPITHEGSI